MLVDHLGEFIVIAVLTCLVSQVVSAEKQKKKNMNLI